MLSASDELLASSSSLIPKASVSGCSKFCAGTVTALAGSDELEDRRTMSSIFEALLIRYTGWQNEATRGTTARVGVLQCIRCLECLEFASPRISLQATGVIQATAVSLFELA